MICRVLPFQTADGPRNMATDEALLELVARDPSSAWFRPYGWSEPTLSLGYFQRWGEVEADPRWRAAAKVRRATGGGAIWHEHELTFAVVIPSSHRLTRPNTALYRAVHRATADVLAALRVDARRHADLGPAGAGAELPAHPFLCFAGRDGEDLVHQAANAKLLGSAQRRRAGAVLQHSSLLLRRAEAVPELPGAADLADVPDDPRSWSDLIADALIPALGMEPVASSPPDGFAEAVARIEREVYRNPAWNHKR